MKRYQGLVAIVVAAVVLAVLFTFSPVRILAGQMLQVFRVNRVEVLHFDPADVQQLENAMQTYGKNVDVASFGTFTHEQLADCSLVDSNTVAIDTQQITIPGAIGAYRRSGQLQLNQGEMLLATPKVAGINSFLTSLGSKSLLPASLDGKTFTIKIPGSVAATFAQPGAASQLTLFRAPSPTLTVPGGVDVQEVRDALLAVPILPEGIRNTLGGIDLSSIYSGTLMIPDFGIDSRGGSIQQITVNGNQGVLITPPQSPDASAHRASKTGKPAAGRQFNGNALVWPQGGVWNCLEGSFTAGEASALAAAVR